MPMKPDRRRRYPNNYALQPRHSHNRHQYYCDRPRYPQYPNYPCIDQDRTPQSAEIHINLHSTNDYKEPYSNAKPPNAMQSISVPEMNTKGFLFYVHSFCIKISYIYIYSGEQ